ncbi:putative disease resistance protein At1g50180 [Coffea arabica]|uniref:Disease resistance protein At1g50180 n=1 Tax=Coffea arabica TaxID=13443 RepID=A0A6P6WZF5_COFAR|nr:probable disease resistance protein RF45 [Coffea arabica]
MAEPVVSFIIERLSNLLIEEGKFLRGVSDQAEQLQSELKLMQALLRDADAKQHDDAVIREWISQCKDLAYEAEDLIETFAFKVGSRRRGGLVNVLKRYACVFKECYMRHRVGVDIQGLNTRVSKLTQRFRDYGIRTIMEKEGPSSRQLQSIRRTYSHVEEDDFVGLESDVKMLVQNLVSEDGTSHYRVVSLCGMGGLGKTTIARKVYNHPNVRRHFDSFAWLCISQQWQTKEILQGILVKLIPERKEEIVRSWNDDELVRQLYHIQQNKRCLIVLDDIWSTDAWECIKNAFPTREKGSKILLTTRNKNVATHIGPNGFHHEPRLLSYDESWELLQKKALRERYNHGNEDIVKLEELGMEMVKHCGGLPLAVVVLGGILSTKDHFSEWEFVYQHIKFYLGRGERIGQREGEIQRILALSYYDLPYQLKPCFLYLGIYPEDHDIRTDSLYQIWMAEGMVSKEDQIEGESMMDVAERYLGEFVKRCMVQVKLKDEPGYRKFESCRLHDLMRDLCLAKGRDENFLKVNDYRHNDNLELIESTSSGSKSDRLVISLSRDEIPKYVPHKKKTIRHVRSLTFCIRDHPYYHRLARTRFSNFRMLRVLNIEGLSYLGGNNCKDNTCILFDFFKLTIEGHIHLRYLSLRNSDAIILQSSIGKLDHLETLDLYRFNVGWIANVLWKLRRLRHLYLPNPQEWALINRMCKLRLAGLIKLEILENFSAFNCEVRDLQQLTSLQVLKAIVIGENDGEEIMKCISSLQHLKEATVRFAKNNSLTLEKCSNLLEKLFESNLHHLTLDRCFGVLPDYKLHFLKNLNELSLRDSSFRRDPMVTLEKLPNLQKLWLIDVSFRTEMACHSLGFPRLRFLGLDVMERLEDWRVEEGAMPHLSHLRIRECTELKMIPDGLKFISTLKEIVIQEMPDTFNNRVRVIDGQEGEDFYKVSHVPSILIS